MQGSPRLCFLGGLQNCLQTFQYDIEHPGKPNIPFLTMYSSLKKGPVLTDGCPRTGFQGKQLTHTLGLLHAAAKPEIHYLPLLTSYS